MVFLRWLFGVPLAGLITIVLFAMMAGMIKIDRGISDSRDNPDIDIFPKIVETPERGNPPIEKLQKLKNPPPVEIPPTERSKAPGPIYSAKPGPPKNTGPEFGSGRMAGPIISYIPPYPDSCRSRGATGQVLVQFDVSPEGNVVNARVIEAPDRCFNRIISTVSKWKYPPTYENGRPVMRYGVVERFDFRLMD